MRSQSNDVETDVLRPRPTWQSNAPLTCHKPPTVHSAGHSSLPNRLSIRNYSLPAFCSILAELMRLFRVGYELR